jgi:hypothetical protein
MSQSPVDRPEAWLRNARSCQFVEPPGFHAGRELTVPDFCIKLRKPLAEGQQLFGGKLHYLALDIFPTCS